MFSIIIPLYNKELYISKCLSSVLSQYYEHFEVIIINDGSTDNSLSVVNAFRDSRIRIVNQQNTGVSKARNNGVDLASFEYVAFLDADDWWAPDFLLEQVNLINAHLEAVLWGCNYYYVKNGVFRIEPKGLRADFVSGYVNYVSVYSSSFCVLINCSFVVVSKSAFLHVNGFRPSLKFGEDFDLWIRLAHQGKVAYINKPLSFSNQDVDIANRATGGHKLYSPDEHFIFNLSYLKPYEQVSVELKRLLDGLRVRSLLPYYLSGTHSDAVQPVVREVDFSQQPAYYKRVYHSPLWLVRFYFGFMRFGSVVKQNLLRICR